MGSNAKKRPLCVRTQTKGAGVGKPLLHTSHRNRSLPCSRGHHLRPLPPARGVEPQPCGGSVPYRHALPSEALALVYGLATPERRRALLHRPLPPRHRVEFAPAKQKITSDNLPCPVPAASPHLLKKEAKRTISPQQAVYLQPQNAGGTPCKAYRLRETARHVAPLLATCSERARNTLEVYSRHVAGKRPTSPA